MNSAALRAPLPIAALALLWGSEGVVKVADNNAQVPVQVCHNYVPVNVLGIQVPIEEVEVNPAIPVLTKGDTAPDSSDTCEAAGTQD